MAALLDLPLRTGKKNPRSVRSQKNTVEKLKVTVKSSHTDNPELCDPSNIHSIMPVSQACRFPHSSNEITVS